MPNKRLHALYEHSNGLFPLGAIISIAFLISIPIPFPCLYFLRVLNKANVPTLSNVVQAAAKHSCP